MIAPFKSGFPLVLLAIFAAFSLPTRAASSDADADVQAGAVLYRDKGCGHCHGPAMEGTPKGPSMVDIRSDKEWPAEKMTDHILDGGKKMPPFRDSLTDDEIAQLIAFLRAKNPPVLPPAANGPTDAPPPPPKF